MANGLDRKVIISKIGSSAQSVKVDIINNELGIRQKMFLSHSYDHRIIDGALGGMFVRNVADYLEQFDINRRI